MHQGIPMALCARDSPGTGFSSPQGLTEHVKQHRGLSVGSGWFGRSGESRVWPWWDRGHGDSSCCCRAAALAPSALPQAFPHYSATAPGVGKAASQGRLLPREGCTGTAAELEAPAPHTPLPGSHPGGRWDNIGSLRLCRRHGTRAQGYEPSKKLTPGQPDLAKGCLPRLAEIISSTLFFLMLSNKTEETLRAKAIAQKKRDKPPFMEIETGLFPNHSLSSMARSQ